MLALLRPLVLSLITPSRLSSLIRSLLLIAGGWMVAHGYATEGSWENLITAVSAIVVPIVWSFLEKGFIEKLIRAAGQADAGVVRSVTEAKAIAELQDRVGR